MAGRYQGYHFVRGEDDEGYLSFEVYWQQEGWFWRRLLRLDGEAVGPFTTTTQAYENAMTNKCHQVETVQSIGSGVLSTGTG